MNDNQLPIKSKQYDHPEHYRDRIVRHSSEESYIPAQLQDLLLEQCGHRCTVCREPYYEFHHILPREKGGKTEYENLIVLCPNCHTRVHKDDTPNKKQLKQYKLKQEVSYDLPVIGRLSNDEMNFILRLSKESEEEQVMFMERHQETMMIDDYIEGQKILRRNIGLFYLESEGIIRTDYDPWIVKTDGNTVVGVVIRMTDKGIRWIRYLSNTGMIDLVCNKTDV